VDPYGLYGSGLIPRADVNHYARKLEMFRAFNPQAQAIIIGSSRVLSCDPDVVTRLTGERCFNFWVPGARTETYYSVLRLALDSGAPIKMVIVAVEPEALHPNLPIEPEARFMPEYSKYFVYNPEAQAGFFEKAALLFTLEQTGESITQLGNLYNAQTGQGKLEYRPNGFATWTYWEKQMAEGTFDLEERIDSRIRKYPERSMGLSSFKELGEVREKYWEDFLGLCRERGIKVVAFMPPDHPRLVELLSEVGAEPVFRMVSDYLSETVASAGGTCVAYTNIESFGGDPGEFYDEIHMRPANGALLLEHLFSTNSETTPVSDDEG
jgi:hypothetical protein